MKITVIGAGAIGGTVGALLTQAGYDVTLVDVVPEHVQAMTERGLHLTGIRGDHFYPVHAVLPDQVTAPLETVFLCVKGHFTARAIAQYGPLLAPHGCVVSLQNGLNEEIIAREIGRERTVGAFIHFGADYLEPGLIQLSQEQTIRLGELDGQITPRLSELRLVLSHVMPTEVTDNIWGYLWGKLVYGAMAFAVSTVDAPVHEVLADPRGRRVGRAASVEAARVGQAQGYRLESIGAFDPNAFLPGPDLDARADVELDELAAEMGSSIKQHMGIWRDLRVKRRQTEVDMQSGVVVERGRDLGIPTPVNTAVVRLVKQIEQGERGMDWDNLDVLAASLPA